MFIEKFDVNSIQGADYNPRVITPEAFEKLKESITMLGIIKPILVNKNNHIIIAGHQRTKAIRAVGIGQLPVFMITDVNKTSEIRFNQLHNASDENFGDCHIKIIPGEKVGYKYIDWTDLKIDRPISEIPQANKRQEILKLIVKHGNWGSAVASMSGEILISKQYALACYILKIPLLVYYIEDSMVPTLIEYFKLDYGSYNYESFDKKTFNQSHVQKHRLVSENYSSSRLYENIVIPFIKGQKHLKILDFGAGRKQYAKMLRKEGYDIQAIEFFEKVEGTMSLNIAQLNRDIAILCKFLKEGNRFDVVLCDSVLNSVDTQQAEDDVLTVLNAFCKKDGFVMYSGRNIAFVESRDKNKVSTASKERRGVEFLDKDNISAIFRSGVWTYQKFHSYENIIDLNRKFFSPIKPIIKGTKGGDFEAGNTEPSWQVMTQKKFELPAEMVKGAIEREFNMPLPSGKRVNKHEEVLMALAQYWTGKK